MNDTSAWEELGTVRVACGDPVTVCDFYGLFFDIVRRVYAFGWIGGLVSATAVREGTKWIRGHHAADSEQGAALIAAQALLR